jgi:hypothetical protein
MTDNQESTSMPPTFGRISGIMSGIFTKAQTALQQGEMYSEPHCVYHDALERILADAERAEGLWSQYLSSALPEHAERAVTPYPEREDYDGAAAYLDDVERWETTNETPASE